MTNERKRNKRRRAVLDALAAAPEYLTRRQAAHIAGTTERTIDRWREDGILRTYEHRGSSRGHLVMVSRDELRQRLIPQPAPESASR